MHVLNGAAVIFWPTNLSIGIFLWMVRELPKRRIHTTKEVKEGFDIATRFRTCTIVTMGGTMGHTRILIVDDDLDVLHTLAWYLSEHPVAVVTARGGREALDILRREKIGLAVVDLCLPDMDGIEVLQTAKREGIQTHILILTGMAP